MPEMVCLPSALHCTLENDWRPPSLLTLLLFCLSWFPLACTCMLRKFTRSCTFYSCSPILGVFLLRLGDSNAHVAHIFPIQRTPLTSPSFSTLNYKLSDWIKRQLDHVCPVPTVIVLKVGAQVMLAKNLDVKVCFLVVYFSCFCWLSAQRDAPIVTDALAVFVQSDSSRAFVGPKQGLHMAARGHCTSGKHPHIRAPFIFLSCRASS